MTGYSGELSRLQKWWIATRPFSFPASTMPVIFGTVAACAFGGAHLDILLFMLSLLGVMLLHASSNLLNDACDFKLGLDTQVFPVSGAVVRKLLKPEEALKGAILFTALGALIGFYIAACSSLHVIWIGALGVAGGSFYSAGPKSLKFMGFGDFSVFLAFGVLGALGAWTVQTASPSWLPVIWSVPIGLLIIGILHVNNWRDVSGDSSLGFRSVASLLGDRASLYYYAFLIFAPYLLVVFFVVLPGSTSSMPALPAWCLAVMLSLPIAFANFKKAINRHNPVNADDFVALDGATAKLNLVFSLLFIAGILPLSFS